MLKELEPIVLEVAQLGEEVLYKRAIVVSLGDIKNPVIQQLIKDMIVTIEHHDNIVGLAAPQVFQNKRIVVIRLRPIPRCPELPEFKKVMINPVISLYSSAMDKGWEGCLSIPGFVGLVPRAERIYIRYRTETGKEEEFQFEGTVARYVQHEVDHLDGILYPARLESLKDLVARDYWDKKYGKQVPQRPQS
jgi:peptide deformylase